MQNKEQMLRKASQVIFVKKLKRNIKYYFTRENVVK